MPDKPKEVMSQKDALNLIFELDAFSAQFWFAVLVVDTPTHVAYISACGCEHRADFLKKLFDKGATPVGFIGIKRNGSRPDFICASWASHEDKTFRDFFRDYMNSRVAYLLEMHSAGRLEAWVTENQDCSHKVN